MRILLTVLEYIASIVLYIILISVGTYLLDNNIVNLKFKEITQYFYYFGLGILSYFPCIYIIGYHKRLNNK